MSTYYKTDTVEKVDDSMADILDDLEGMEEYVGIKHIKARSMVWGDFVKHIKNKYNEKVGEPDKFKYNTKGYLVGYPGIDGRTFDGSREGGCRYFNWTPKEIFEGVYKEVEKE